MSDSEIEYIEILMYEVRVYHEQYKGNIMKSHELAKLLLEQPDLEIFVETERREGTGRSYHSSALQPKFEITPDGLFVDVQDLVDGKPPQHIPVIGSYFVHFKDGTITPARLPNVSKHQVPTVQFFSTGEVREVEYGSYNLEKCDCYQVLRMGLEKAIILSTNDEYFDQLDPVYTENKRVMRLCDVSHISVLTSFDQDTWNCTYTDMTYDEVMAYRQTMWK